MRPIFLGAQLHDKFNTPAGLFSQDTQIDLFLSGNPCAPFDVQAENENTLTASVTLQGTDPRDQVNVVSKIAGDLDLAAYDPQGTASTSTTVTANVNLTVGGNVTTATEQLGLTLGVEAYLPSIHALVDVAISDVILLNLKGIGFLGTSTAHVTDSTNTTATGGSGSATKYFDLGSFVATVLNQDSLQIQVGGLCKGESVQLQSKSDLSVSASVEYLAGGIGSAVTSSASYHQDIQSATSFARAGS